MSRACHELVWQCIQQPILLFSFSDNQVVFTNSVDPDDMSYYAEFHLSLHCFQKSSDSELTLWKLMGQFIKCWYFRTRTVS